MSKETNQQISKDSTSQTHSVSYRLREWVCDVYHRIRPYLPPLRSKKFWFAQALVIVIATIHGVIEIGGYFSNLHVLYFIPVSLFIVPVIYTTINFGFLGGMATTLWIIIITIPNWVILHQGLETMGSIFQMAILLVVTAIVGNRVDREKKAIQQTKEASNTARVFAAHVIQAQEEERKKIARELHDETIQMLTLLHQRLDSVESNTPSLPPAVVEGIKESRQIADKAIKELREFTRSIRPPILDDLGVVPAIRRLVIDSTKRLGIKNHFRFIGEERRLPQEIEEAMFRITQEAIRNVERHSKATEVMATITLDREEVRLRISDNGIGFNASHLSSNYYSTGKYGLLGMQERAELIDGKLEVHSNLGKGTTVVFSAHIS